MAGAARMLQWWQFYEGWTTFPGGLGGVKTVNAALMKQGYEHVLLKVLLNLAMNISASLSL